MNDFFKIILLFILGGFVVSCRKDDNNTSAAPLKDYAEQYAIDIANIETFLKSHYIEVANNPGATNDMDVAYYELPLDGSKTSIWDSPDLVKDFTVKQYYDQNDNTKVQLYTVYYLKLRQGSGTTSKSPCNVDKVLTSYRGEFIYTDTTVSDPAKNIKSTQFEESINPQSYFDLTQVIRGWSEVFPKFSTGSYSGNTDGTISYNDFGAGVMFIPSGLAYYNAAKGTIPVYSPLIFSFKLYEVQRADQDADGIPSYQEDIDGDGYVRTFPTKPSWIQNYDNTDEALEIARKEKQIPDFMDIDDDDDYFTTGSEINNPLTSLPYPFDQIPLCTDGKKKHLSTVCH